MKSVHDALEELRSIVGGEVVKRDNGMPALRVPGPGSNEEQGYVEVYAVDKGSDRCQLQMRKRFPGELGESPALRAAGNRVLGEWAFLRDEIFRL